MRVADVLIVCSFTSLKGDARNEQEQNGVCSAERVFSVNIMLCVFQLRKLQKVRGPVNLVIKFARVGKLEPILHSGGVLHPLEVVVPAAHIWHHVEAHEPAGARRGQSAMYLSEWLGPGQLQPRPHQVVQFAANGQTQVCQAHGASLWHCCIGQGGAQTGW